MHRVGIIVALLALAFTACDNHSHGEKSSPKAIEALIVPSQVWPRSGVAKVSAVHIINKEKLSALEHFFPGYSQRPTSPSAGAWEMGYEVFFCFAGGETVRVSVSQNENGASWSTGSGDFRTNGDFPAFVRQLVP
ncbi:MAG TPA: hypothetical protein VHZ24_18140 [Pirellulales bacterium]|jgi:hypothetical protein|nr:hypothetical protein [Pirellulales bacterium]